MPIGMIFWMLMILWFVFGVMHNMSPGALGAWGWLPGTLLLFILLFLLGWHSFGFVVKG